MYIYVYIYVYIYLYIYIYIFILKRLRPIPPGLSWPDLAGRDFEPTYIYIYVYIYLESCWGVLGLKLGVVEV